MERLFKSGLITTIIGVLLLAGTVYLYMSKEHTKMEAAELGAVALIFLRSKDSLIGLTPKKEGDEG
jgi:hypothetical protein